MTILEKDSIIFSHHAFIFPDVNNGILCEYIKKESELCGKKILIKNFDFFSFGVDDSRSLKSDSSLKNDNGVHTFFVISFSGMTIEAGNALLKVFEEPVENNHFILCTKDKNSILPTLASRCIMLPEMDKLFNQESRKEVEVFLLLSIGEKIVFIDKLVKEVGESEDKSKYVTLLNGIEYSINEKLLLAKDKNYYQEIIEKIFFVRKSLRLKGASPKMLLETIAVSI